MRPARSLALCVVLVFLAACSGGDHASDAPPDRATPRPAQFAIRPNIADPLCNGGHGLRLSARLGGSPLVAAGAMEDGSTVIAVSDYATKNTVDLYAVSASCVPVREFGRAGRATVTPSSRPPAHTDFETLPDALWVNAVTPSNGGALIAGAYGGRWMVGAVTREGRVDPTFGNGGWAVLPFHGAVTAILRAPSGRIVVAGESRGPMWVAALSARGHLERGFGTDGRTMLPPLGADAGVTALAVEPSGEVLANIAFGSTGCWGDALVRLTPSGRPAPRFRKKLGPFGRFWQRLGFSAFVGDIYTDDDGFTLVGTGQRPCVGPPGSASAPSATGLIARFRKNGRRAGPVVRFASRMYGKVWALRKDKDTVVVMSPYADPTRLALAARHPDGSLDPRFGSQGRARIRTPWRGRDDTTVVVIRAPPRAITVVAARGGRNHLQIVRVLL